MLACAAGFPHVWDADLYGRLLKIGGGKERMSSYFQVSSMAPTSGTHMRYPHPYVEVDDGVDVMVRIRRVCGHRDWLASCCYWVGIVARFSYAGMHHVAWQQWRVIMAKVAGNHGQRGAQAQARVQAGRQLA